MNQPVENKVHNIKVFRHCVEKQKGEHNFGNYVQPVHPATKIENESLFYVLRVLYTYTRKCLRAAGSVSGISFKMYVRVAMTQCSKYF